MKSVADDDSEKKQILSSQIGAETPKPKQTTAELTDKLARLAASTQETLESAEIADPSLIDSAPLPDIANSTTISQQQDEIRAKIAAAKARRQAANSQNRPGLL